MTGQARKQIQAAKEFAKTWAEDCKEDGNTAPFWLGLLRDVYGVEQPEKVIFFEETVKHEDKGNSLFIDARIPSTRVIIEQKAAGIALDKPYTRHGRRYDTVYDQAFEYDQTQPVSERALYIITCNFHEFWIYNMNVAEKDRKPLKLPLADLPQHLDTLAFLVDKTKKPEYHDEVEVSVLAGRLVGKLYDAFVKIYSRYSETGKPTAADLHAINVLCVRLVFCLYAEDSGLFGAPDMFCRYLESWRIENAQEALQKLFLVLDTPTAQRSRFLDRRLAAFPYVNGGLLHDESVEVPPLTEEIYHILVDDMSKGFNWSRISPTIFGAVFESTLNPETRRKGGMHYTSIENIHKVIDPLFLDSLKEELHHIVDIPEKEKLNQNIKKELVLKYDYRRKLEAFQEKLSRLSFLDPACGSGNFLTETYLCLRRLENRVISELNAGQQLLDTESDTVKSPIRVSIRQFHGIEINDFAVTVAKTALWIAESQMMKETEDIIRKDLDFLPLKTNAFIHEGNALTIPWESVIEPGKLSYIMGNPPFVGYSLQSKPQKEEIRAIYVDENGKPYKAAGKIDYVAGWYCKAAAFMQGTAIRAAFVSTNSITQGEQVAAVWKPLFERFHVHIDFAWRTFIWDSEAAIQAHVHVVIVGFSEAPNPALRRLFDGAAVKEVEEINPYLVAGKPVFLEPRRTPLCEVPEMIKGNIPVDHGQLLIEPDVYDKVVSKDPIAKKYCRPLLGAREFLNGKKRYCLWLKDASAAEMRNSPFIMQRLDACATFRRASTKAATRCFAETPWLFMEDRQPDSDYILVPRHSSENRRYIPMGFFGKDVISTDANSIIPHATLYHFGILESSVHMAWMRAVCGRIKSDYRYSNDIVYNNFPWPRPPAQAVSNIEKTAKAILDARALYPDASLADLYDAKHAYLYPELRKAHKANDRAVMAAYGFDSAMSEEDIVAALMKLYQKLAAENK